MEDIKDIYFSHDAGARYDSKCRALIGVYGMAGYGWFWTIVEMLRQEERTGFKLNMQMQSNWYAIAEQNKTDAESAKKFVQACIDDFNLFTSDGVYFWSESLCRRMKRREEIREKRRKAAHAKHNSANAKHVQKDAEQKGAKKRKGKERKEKGKEDLSPLIPLHFTSHPGFTEAFDGFVESRKKQKPLTERGLKLLVSKLLDLSQDDPATAVKLLDRATESGWLTVWPLKEDHGTNSQHSSARQSQTQRNEAAARGAYGPLFNGAGENG